MGDTSVTVMGRLSDRLTAALRWASYRAYFRLVRLNYERRLLSRMNETAAGTIRTYELVRRHADDPMLAAIESFSDPDAIIYDVGANIGIYAAALASVAPRRRVVAVEPAPRNATHLRATVALNGLGDRVEVRRCGLGDTNERRSFYVSTYPELSGFDRESATRWEATVAERTTVRVRTLDGLAATAPEPDVVKIDVEGDAPAVLAGAEETLATRRPALFIETHDEGFGDLSTAKLRARLRDAGYRITEREAYWRCLPRS